jgi:hypothetical protein
MLFASLTAYDALSQKKESGVPKLPPGNWSLSAHPYFGWDYRDLPVVVYKVTSEARAGVGVTKVGIKNTTDKVVTAVKFGWILYADEDRNKVLQQGRTPLLGLPTDLAAGDSRVLIYPVVSLFAVYKPLLKDGVLNGNFDVEIVVDEVHYTDETTWKRTQEQIGSETANRPL